MTNFKLEKQNERITRAFDSIRSECLIREEKKTTVTQISLLGKCVGDIFLFSRGKKKPTKGPFLSMYHY